MMSWFSRKKNDEDRVSKAKEELQRAEKDHKEVEKLIKLLELEHNKDHYASLVEDALGLGRQKK